VRLRESAERAGGSDGGGSDGSGSGSDSGTSGSDDDGSESDGSANSALGGEPGDRCFASFTWPAARVLAAALWAGRSDLVEGKCVVELGAGTGLGGIVAALAGARSVTLSDRDHKRTLAALAANCALNGLRAPADCRAAPDSAVRGCPVRVLPLEWADAPAALPPWAPDSTDGSMPIDRAGLPDTAAGLLEFPELIIASDIWYERHAAADTGGADTSADELEAAVACLAALLSGRGHNSAHVGSDAQPEALVAYVERDDETSARLCAALRHFGLQTAPLVTPDSGYMDLSVHLLRVQRRPSF